MKLIDIVNREPDPLPWSDDGKIPWNEPGFSARMLKEHLSQSHDLASRRFEKIDRHVEWIHEQVLEKQPTKILDLGCGPGLYTSRLARLGHKCRGIDFSPASIAYAAASAADLVENEQICCTYTMQDIRMATYGENYGLVMLIFGEFNTFSPQDACVILNKAYAALAPGGLLVLEPHTQEAVYKIGKEDASWYSSPAGLFSEKPHICLMENFWDEVGKAATARFYVIEAGTGNICQYASTTQAYSQHEYQQILNDSGFGHITFFPSLAGETAPHSEDYEADFFAIVARKPAHQGSD